MDDRHPTRTLLSAIALLAVASGLSVLAATPPGWVNYQGILRDASGAPVDNPQVTMRFSFWDAETAGNELLVDLHKGSGGPPAGGVAVEGGMFNVWLGAGNVTDGSSPDHYLTLDDVFRRNEEVYLEIVVFNETLAPRVRILATPYAHNTAHFDGRPATDFLDTTTTTQTKQGRFVVDDLSGALDYALEVRGRRGATFTDTDSSGSARLADGDSGVLGFGAVQGGYFSDSAGSGVTRAGYDDRGLEAYGTEMGGYFEDSDSTGYAHVGSGDYGIRGYGNSGGAFFQDLDGGDYVYAARNGYGIRSYGATGGGFFKDRDTNSYAHIGTGSYGIDVYSDVVAARFTNPEAVGLPHVVDIATEDWGIYTTDPIRAGAVRAYHPASSTSAVAYFENTNAAASFAEIATRYQGIHAEGPTGGTFTNQNGIVGQVAFSDDSTIAGNGAKNFIQNHPEAPGDVIVYTSLEGDEAGTYTRGSAQLENGRAVVAIGETFKWVTNPDIGLTVQLTPRGDCNGLYVEHRDTKTIVVRERGGGTSDVAFDYLIQGLRIGFEQSGAVRPKSFEAKLPAMAKQQRTREARPELEKHTALARFRAMEDALRPADTAPVSLDRAHALVAAIGRVDPMGDEQRPQPRPDAGQALPDPGAATVHSEDGGLRTRPEIRVFQEAAVEPEADRRAVVYPALPANEAIARGEVLTASTEHPGSVVPASETADPTLIGVAASAGDQGVVAVATFGVVACRVDAGYGSIRVGDLLTSSPTPGHAMRALEPSPGTILGKALTPLDIGTGTIQVLVMPR